MADKSDDDGDVANGHIEELNRIDSVRVQIPERKHVSISH